MQTLQEIMELEQQDMSKIIKSNKTKTLEQIQASSYKEV